MTSDQNSDQTGSLPDIEELLARLAPPETPLQALDFAPDIPGLISSFDPLKSADLLAGLMTDLRFQANCTRFDWALRMILALAVGARRAKQADLGRLLNDELSRARVVGL